MIKQFDVCIDEIIAGYKKDKNGRHKSYEYRRKCFLDNRYYPEKNDLITLNLYAYLASWGMLRNSFLLYKEYYFNNEVVKKLCSYSSLLNFDSFKQNEKDLEEIEKIKKDIVNCYKGKGYIKDGDQKKIKRVSDTLVTKIILGTLGCVPAYDTYFKSGLDNCFKKEEVKEKGLKKFNKNSMKEIIDFAIEHEEKIRYACEELDKLSEVKGLYTPMKIVDMYFFEVGLEVEKERIIKQQTNIQNP